MQNVTWPQVVILIACLAASFAAFKFLGQQAAGATIVASTVLNFLMGRGEAPPAVKTE